MTTVLPLVFVAILLAVIALSALRVVPQGAVQVLRIGFGAALAVAAVWALLARQVAIALGLAGIAMALLRPLVGAWRATPSPGRTSEARTEAIAMTLDHDTGDMEGEVLQGRFEGRRLSELTPEELQALVDEVEGDEETAALLMAYLERRGVDAGDGPEPAPDARNMTEADAYRVLGLAPGASLEEVRAAYRRLMKKVHPDLGGSPALAALINAAKQRLDPGKGDSQA